MVLRVDLDPKGWLMGILPWCLRSADLVVSSLSSMSFLDITFRRAISCYLLQSKYYPMISRSIASLLYLSAVHVADYAVLDCLLQMTDACSCRCRADMITGWIPSVGYNKKGFNTVETSILTGFLVYATALIRVAVGRLCVG
jgi:hypothetical protein